LLKQQHKKLIVLALPVPYVQFLQTSYYID